MAKPKPERWRSVLGYEGIYQVSDLGNIRRVGGALIKPYLRPEGYASVALSKSGKVSTFSVHTLVAESFCRGFGREVNHRNGKKHDNKATNLEWSTRSLNILHAYRVLGRSPATGKGKR